MKGIGFNGCCQCGNPTVRRIIALALEVHQQFEACAMSISKWHDVHERSECKVALARKQNPNFTSTGF